MRSVEQWARQVEHTVQLRVDGLTASRQLDQCGFLAAIALVTLQAGDSAVNSEPPDSVSLKLECTGS